MATDTNILREFLVSLGFKVDSAEKFKQSIEDATKTVAKLGTALEALGLVGLAALNKVTQKYVELGYLSQTLQGTPIRSIMAFTQALGLSGITADQAKGALKSLGEAIRESPGLEGMLNGYGVRTKDANGKWRNMAKVMMDLGKAFKTMPDFQAYNIGAQFGLDQDMVRALERNPEKYYNQSLKNMDKEGFTEKKAQEMVQAAKHWQDRWTQFMQTVTIETDRMWIKLAVPFGKIIKFLKELDAQTGGVSTKFIALGAALLPVMAILGPIATLVLGLAGAIVILYNDFQSWKEGGQSLLPWADWAPQLQGITQDLQEIGKALSDVFGGANLGNLGGVLKAFVKDELQALKDMLDAILHGLEAIKAFKHGDSRGGLNKLGEAAKSVGHAIIGDQAKAVMDEFHAWNQSPQKGGRVGIPGNVGAVAGQVGSFLASKGLDSDHIRGIMAGIYAEGGMNPDVVSGKKRGPKYGAFGIGQWLGSRRDELFKRYGPNPNLSQQLEFLWYELTGGDKTSNGAVLRTRGGAEAILGSYVNRLMRPGPGAAGDLTRGRNWLAQHPNSNFTQINNKVDIHVHGSGDPKATADAVARQQQRVYGNSARWNKPAAS